MFPIQMTFTVSTPAELAKLVAATAPANDKAAIHAEAPKAEGDKPEGVPEKATNVAKEGTPDPKPETAAASAAQPAATASSTTAEQTAAASGLDYDKDVKPAFLKLVQTKGRAAGRKIIDAFAPTKEKLSEAITTQEQYKQALDLIAKELA